MFDPIIEAMCQRVGWTLIHFVWQGIAVALLLSVVLAFTKQGAARTRYAAGCAALMAMVILPWVTFCSLEASPRDAGVMAEDTTLADVISVDLPLPVPPESVAREPELSMPVPVTAEPVDMPKGQRFSQTLETSVPYVSLVWLIGVMILSIWHMGGWLTLQQFKRSVTSDVDASVSTIFDRLADQMGVRRAVSLYESSKVHIPTVIGWVKPVVLLPVSAMSGLNAEQIEAILAHELAHVQRQDYLVNMLQTFVEILGFYHPAVWWVSHQIRIEREHCCDDLAVTMCGNSMAYARALTHLEAVRPQGGILAMAATGGSLTKRIKRLVVHSETCERTPVWMPSLLLVLVFVAVAYPVAMTWAQSHARAVVDVNERASVPSELAATTTPIQETRIYDITDLVTGQAGSKERSLEANFFAERMKGEIEPESWSQASGEGTCTVYDGRKLAVLHTRAVHNKIDLYLESTRQYGGFLDGSVLPEGWKLEYMPWDQNDLEKLNGSAAVSTFLWVRTFKGKTRQDEECTLRITTFSGQPELRISDAQVDETGAMLVNQKYLVFFHRAWGKHPDNGDMQSGPFLLNLSKPGKYRLIPATQLGTGEILGSHEGTYAVNYQSIDRFPVISGTAYQGPPDDYRIDGLAAGHYFLSAVAEHDGGNVLVRRAQVKVGARRMVRMDLARPDIGNCSLSGTIYGKPSSVQAKDGFSWAVLVRSANARPVTTWDAHASVTMDTDYVIQGRNIVQETGNRAHFKATGLSPGKYSVTAIERHPRKGFEFQRQQSKPLTIEAGESVTLDFGL